ncbi:hypothetical protein ABT010_10680 [Streptomyces sp. NPDC002668]|uniref:hypothetical protein n=1 Tax=Streptomyces sp. NPDC002668 TaxID=3154422 RepID=UPI003319F863
MSAGGRGDETDGVNGKPGAAVARDDCAEGRVQGGVPPGPHGSRPRARAQGA